MAPAGRGAGVTLLEMLVVLALVGVLATWAYPSYRAHLLRAHRFEAIEALLAVAAAQERHHLGHGRYAAGLEPEVSPGLDMAPVTTGGRYRLLVSASEPDGFVARAQVQQGSGQDGDARCSEFGLDEAGRRWASDRAGGDSTRHCWR